MPAEQMWEPHYTLYNNIQQASNRKEANGLKTREELQKKSDDIKNENPPKADKAENASNKHETKKHKKPKSPKRNNKILPSTDKKEKSKQESNVSEKKYKNTPAAVMPVQNKADEVKPTTEITDKRAEPLAGKPDESVKNNETKTNAGDKVKATEEKKEGKKTGKDENDSSEKKASVPTSAKKEPKESKPNVSNSGNVKSNDARNIKDPDIKNNEKLTEPKKEKTSPAKTSKNKADTKSEKASDTNHQKKITEPEKEKSSPNKNNKTETNIKSGKASDVENQKKLTEPKEEKSASDKIIKAYTKSEKADDSKKSTEPKEEKTSLDKTEINKTNQKATNVDNQKKTTEQKVSKSSTFVDETNKTNASNKHLTVSTQGKETNTPGKIDQKKDKVIKEKNYTQTTIGSTEKCKTSPRMHSARVITVKEAEPSEKVEASNNLHSSLTWESSYTPPTRKVSSAPVRITSTNARGEKPLSPTNTGQGANVILVKPAPKPKQVWLQANHIVPPTPEGPKFQQNGSSLTYTHPGVQDDMLQKLNALRTTGELCDVVIKVQGIEFRAHKIVLSSSCAYFAELFKNIKTVRIDRLILEGLTAHSVAAMLGYFYLAKLIIDAEDIEELIDAAYYFKSSEVIQLCTDYLQLNLNIHNCYNYYKVSAKHDIKGLRAKTFRFLCWNFNSIVKERPFLEIDVEHLIQVISSSSVKVKSEEEVYSAVWEWYRYNIEDRKFHVPKVCIHLHFEIMSLEFLEERVKKEMYVASELCRKKVDDAINMIKNKVDIENLSAYRQASDNVYIFDGTSANCKILDLKTSTTEDAPEFLLPALINNEYHVTIKAGKNLYTLSKQSVLLFDSSRLQWDQVCEGISIEDSAVCSSKKSIFVVGGKTNGKQLWELDTNTLKWNRLPDMKHDRKSPAAAVMGNTKPRIFVAGGYSVTKTTVLNTMECYHVTDKQWKPIKNTMCMPRFQASMIVKNDKVYVVGGKNMEKSWDSAECYDRATEKWKLCDGELTERKLRSPLINFEGKIYSIGGQECTSIEVLEDAGKSSKWKYIGSLDDSNKEMQCVAYQPI
ncbi:kelch-like protein diablo [Hydractinia symbiolongicarpus]|uniref:kelch-like protein diablo n=1 Tax=Hydractinia symbiolongicarpus TaxID=13093 RepID=UPI0025508F68|nr:kelch-like protein diablo [Hydractinia symbiolongicarpus]